MWKKLLIALAVGVVLGAFLRHSFESACEPWKPVLEETGFHYLSEQANALGRFLQIGSKTLETNQLDDAAEALASAQGVLDRLQFYYFPLTQIRQLVYDADRLYFLGEQEDALEKLHQARGVLRVTENGQGSSIRRIEDDLVLRVEDASLAVEKRSELVPQKLRNLGHKVNLLVLKGELEL